MAVDSFTPPTLLSATLMSQHRVCWRTRLIASIRLTAFGVRKQIGRSDEWLIILLSWRARVKVAWLGFFATSSLWIIAAGRGLVTTSSLWMQRRQRGEEEGEMPLLSRRQREGLDGEKYGEEMRVIYQEQMKRKEGKWKIWNSLAHSLSLFIRIFVQFVKLYLSATFKKLRKYLSLSAAL